MKTKIKKLKKVRLLRGASQILFFILLPGLYLSALNSLGQIYTAAVHGTFSFPAMLPQLTIIVAVFPITIILGRFFLRLDVRVRLDGRSYLDNIA